MKRIILPSALLLLLFVLMGCASIPPLTLAQAYPQMYSERPVSILILPPVNNTTAADAREYFSCSLAEAIGLRGYYPLPVEAVFDVLRDEGLYDAELIDPAVLSNLKKHFGADLVLYSTIDKWDKSWFLTSGSLTIEAKFALLGTATADTLWDYRARTVVNLSSSNDNLLFAAIESAIKTAVEDYFPNARQANILTFQKALPYGKYHPEAGTDGSVEIPSDKYGYLQINK